MAILSRARASLLIFVLGALGGALLDQIHVRAHVLVYAHPDLAGQPWWVAPQFGVAVVAIFVAAVAIARVEPGGDRDRVPLAVDAGAFVLAYALTGVLRAHPAAIFIVLTTLWLALLFVHRDVAALATSVMLALVGPAYESVLSGSGAFAYTTGPLVARVPVWLPGLYLVGGVLASRAARAAGVLLARRPPSRETTGIAGSSAPGA
jgi:hypothetical protein